MRKHYMVEVGLRENSLRIEADDQTGAIRLAKDVVLEDGLLIFVQGMYEEEPAGDKAPDRALIMWRPGRDWSDQRNLNHSGMVPAPKI
jgi:hypothetical protein